MNKCTFEKLSEKEVINSCDCSRLGNIVDLIIDLECGRILYLIVCENKGVFLPTSKNEPINIPWERICKIGEDIILVDIPPVPRLHPAKERDKKKFFS